MKLLRIFRKKESGNVGQLLPSLLTVFVVFYLIILYLTVAQDLERKNNLDMLARQYIIRMETFGKLTSDDRDNLKAALEGMGCRNIDFSGTDMTEVGYGNPVNLSITGEIPTRRIVWLAGLNTGASDEYISFTIRKASTGKY